MRRVSLSLLLGAAAILGCGPDEVSSPTREAELAKGEGGLPVLRSARVGQSGSFTLPEAAQKYHITLRFVNTPTADQVADFTTAASRWEGLIHGDVADLQGSFPANACGASFPMPAFSGVIDDILINVLLQPIDGPGNILGAAGACFIRTAGGLPVFGLMFFDVADLAFLETNNLLDEVIVHEMGHVLGFSGGFFNRAGLLANVFPGTTDPRFLGKTALGKYRMLGGSELTIPIEGFGGRCGGGTALSHWDEGTFFNELMTGFINGASSNFINPMSPMTSGALADLGYVVTPQGEDYELRPSPADPCPPPAPATAAVDGLNIAAQEIIIDAVGRVE
ncbi:MAG TPA: leishmanolysin-related zinc metalloendopeptidase [Gemmatimonadales bacterium]